MKIAAAVFLVSVMVITISTAVGVSAFAYDVFVDHAKSESMRAIFGFSLMVTAAAMVVMVASGIAIAIAEHFGEVR